MNELVWLECGVRVAAFTWIAKVASWDSYVAKAVDYGRRHRRSLLWVV